MSQKTITFKTWVTAKNKVRFKTDVRIVLTQGERKLLRALLYTKLLVEPPCEEEICHQEGGEPIECWKLELPQSLFKVITTKSSNNVENNRRIKEKSTSTTRVVKGAGRTTNISSGIKSKDVPQFETT